MATLGERLGPVDRDGLPQGAPPAGRRTRIRRLFGIQTLLVIALIVIGVLVGIQLAPGKHEARSRGPALACDDVAARTGLSFVGEYGSIYDTRDDMGKVMQRDMGNGAAVADYNGDGFLDVFLESQAGHHSKLFRNDAAPFGGRKFTDVTTEAGLDSIIGNVRVAQFVDLSGSGRPDLVVATDYDEGKGGQASRIFRNVGDGTFQDVTAGSGFDPTGYIVGGMTFADYDGSGRQSIYLSYWTEELAGDPALMRIKGAFPGMNRLYRNLGNFHFEDVTLTSGLGDTRADSFTAIFADFDGDHLPDIYQASDHRHDKYFKNLGGGKFKDMSGPVGITARAGNSMGVAASDLDGNGMLDLFITQITDPGRRFGTNTGNTLMVSGEGQDGVTFTDQAAQRGVLDTAWGWGTAFVDANLDGALDLYAVQGMREFVSGDSIYLEHATSKMFLNDGTGKQFTEAEGTGCDLRGDQRALVVFDYNRDGSPDLLYTQVATPAVLLENLLTGPHWLTVAPSAPGDGGINARVSVTAAGRTTTQIVLAGGSYLAGPPREVYFGLGTATTADRVRIEWADGTVTERVSVPSNQLLRVEKP